MLRANAGTKDRSIISVVYFEFKGCCLSRLKHQLDKNAKQGSAHHVSACEDLLL